MKHWGDMCSIPECLSRSLTSNVIACSSKTSHRLGNKALLSSGDTFRVLAELGDINLIEIDVAQGKQWSVITSLLDSGLLMVSLIQC